MVCFFGKLDSTSCLYFFFLGADTGTMSTAFTNIDNCYNIPNFYVEGKSCKTNTPPNSYCRGPGWTEAVYIMEVSFKFVMFFFSKKWI